MGVFSRLRRTFRVFTPGSSGTAGDGSGSGSSSDDPPKPAVGERSKEVTLSVYAVDLEYRNGDTETLRTYGLYGREKHGVRYKMAPRYHEPFMDGKPYVTYSKRTVNYEVLAREPILREVGEETWELRWWQDYRLDNQNLRHVASEWRVVPEETTLERVSTRVAVAE